MFKKLKQRQQEYFSDLITASDFNQSLNSYNGLMSHADTHNLKSQVLNQFGEYLS